MTIWEASGILVVSFFVGNDKGDVLNNFVIPLAVYDNFASCLSYGALLSVTWKSFQHLFD